MIASTRRRRRQPTEREDDAQFVKFGPARWVLRGADRNGFLKAVRDPPEPSEELIAALRRHRALFG
jgi:hypothetical protein